MRCTKCGNISRFEVYRLVLERVVLDLNQAKEGRARSAIEYWRNVEAGPPLVIRCIKCGEEGSPKKFNFTEQDLYFTDPEDREGHRVPERIPQLNEVKVKMLTRTIDLTPGAQE